MSFEAINFNQFNLVENNNEAEAWQESPEVMKTKELYKGVIDERDANYQRAVEANPELQTTKEALDIHNDIVLHYAVELSQDLPPKEKAAAILGTLLHDSGKLEAALPDHHTAGVEYAKGLLERYRGQRIAEVEVDQEVIDSTLGAIERHMNHPFVVKNNGGELMPVPENEVDRVVYSADMLANDGFKNTGFRLLSPDFIKDDKAVAEEEGITHLQAAVENVVSGVENLRKEIEELEEKASKPMLTEQARGLLDGHALRVKLIFEKMKAENLFEKIHEEVGAEIGPEQKKRVAEIINEEIKRIGKDMGYNEQDLQHYQM